MNWTERILAMMVALALLAGAAAPARAQNQPARPSARTGNVIFIHPDGSALNHWNAARLYWAGPDGLLEWDRLPELALYRGHLSDRLAATSNGGATAHAFGYKVAGAESYGSEGWGSAPPRPILALSGYPGSILREAAAQGYPVGVVNDGDAAEPGTGAFLAEVTDRDEATEIVRQILEGRPGMEDAPPDVVLGGGEAFFLPEGTPRCGDAITLDCAVHADVLDGSGPARTDGRNLLREAEAAGWLVIRTRAEFDALRDRLASEPELAPRVLGLFAADDLFNDASEEVLVEQGLEVAPQGASDAARRMGDFILWGDRPGTPGYNPPSAAEMAEVAITILQRRSAAVGKPFLLVAEVESSDNFAGSNNAIGTLRALRAADAVIGVARAFQAEVPRTLILTAADSDAGGMQIVSPPLTDDDGLPEPIEVNPMGSEDDTERVRLDGRRGHAVDPATDWFYAAPDEFGAQQPFLVAWAGVEDLAGGVVARAQGFNALALRTRFGGRLDNTDVYRLMYLTLFGEFLPAPPTPRAPDR